MTSLFICGLIYVIWAFVAAQLLMWEVAHYQRPDQFSERGMVETAQWFCLAVAIVAAFIRAKIDIESRSFFLCVGLSLLVLLIREQDQLFELWLTDGFWKWPAGAVMIGLAVVFIRQRRLILGQLDQVKNSLAMGTLITGVTVLVFTRLFGRGIFWQELMGNDYIRVVKNAAEEGTELFALGLIAIGVIELSRLPMRRAHVE